MTLATMAMVTMAMVTMAMDADLSMEKMLTDSYAYYYVIALTLTVMHAILSKVSVF